MTVREARKILGSVRLSDCKFEKSTSEDDRQVATITGLKDTAPVSYGLFVQAWDRMERFHKKY